MIHKVIKETKDYNNFGYDVFISSIFVLNNHFSRCSRFDLDTKIDIFFIPIGSS